MTTQTAQALQPYAELSLTVLTLLMLGVLVWYTIETARLRRAAQKQNSISLLPIVELSIDACANTFKIRNIGRGPAFNVAIQHLPGQRGRVSGSNIQTRWHRGKSNWQDPNSGVRGRNRPGKRSPIRS